MGKTDILMLLALIAVIALNVVCALDDKRLKKHIDNLDERLSVFDGGSNLLKKYENHSAEVRIRDLEFRLSILEQSGLIQKSNAAGASEIQKQPSPSTDFQKAIANNINIDSKKCNEALKKRHYFPFF